MVVGAWNTLFSYCVYVALYRALRLIGAGEDASGLVAVTLSWVVAIPIAYVAYKLLVFETRGNVKVELVRFVTSNVGVALTNVGLLAPTFHLLPLGPLVRLGVLLATPFHLDALVDRATVAQALLQVVLAVGSYLAHRHFSFRPKPSGGTG